MSASVLPQFNRLSAEIDRLSEAIGILASKVGDLQQRLSVLEAHKERQSGPNQRRGGKAASNRRD